MFYYLFSLLPTLAHAETCTATPDCKSLGYTESSCPDGGGVKCPWNTNLMYCPQCKSKDVCQSCYVGWILNSDMTCTQNRDGNKTPIGVVSQQVITSVGAAIKCQAVAIALNDLDGTMTWSNANSKCSSYSAGGVTGWRLPKKDELLAAYSNRSSVMAALSRVGGSDFTSNWYWSSSVYGSGSSGYWIVNPVSASKDYLWVTNSRYVRPVLAFSWGDKCK